MRDIPSFAVLGNLREESLFGILGRTLFRNFVERREMTEQDFIGELGGVLTVDQFSAITDAIQSQRKPITNDEIREAVVRPDSGVHWDIDYVVKDIFTIFGSDVARLWMTDFSANFVDSLFAEGGRFPKSLVLPSIIMSEGKASVEKGKTVRVDSLGSAYRPPLGSLPESCR